MSAMNHKATTIGKTDLPTVKTIGEIATGISDYRTAQLRGLAFTT